MCFNDSNITPLDLCNVRFSQQFWLRFKPFNYIDQYIVIRVLDLDHEDTDSKLLWSIGNWIPIFTAPHSIRLTFSPLNLLDDGSQICRQDLTVNFLWASLVPLYIEVHCHFVHTVQTIAVQWSDHAAAGTGLTVTEVITDQLWGAEAYLRSW